jgi:CRISPR-associated protein Csx16
VEIKVQIVGHRLELSAQSHTTLALACGDMPLPALTVEDFAAWLIAPHCESRPAIQHGARLILADKFTVAFVDGVDVPAAGKRVWSVTRHPGALAWLHSEGVRPHRAVSHLVAEDLAPGDTVVDILPLGLAAELCERGVRCLHLHINLQRADRGREPTAAEMRSRGARLDEFVVSRRQAASQFSA